MIRIEFQVIRGDPVVAQVPEPPCLLASEDAGRYPTLERMVERSYVYVYIDPRNFQGFYYGKIVAHRQPVNGYRLFKQEELDEMLTAAQRPSGIAVADVRKPR